MGMINNEDCKDNAIEWYYGDKRAAGSFYTKKHVNRIKSLAAKYPDEVDYVENNDGSIFCHFPLSYLKITRPAKRELTEEQRQAAAERFARYREERKSQ